MKYFKAIALAFLSICGLNMLVPDLQARWPRWQDPRSRYRKKVQALRQAQKERRAVRQQMSQTTLKERLDRLIKRKARLDNHIAQLEKSLAKEEAKPTTTGRKGKYWNEPATSTSEVSTDAEGETLSLTPEQINETKSTQETDENEPEWQEEQGEKVVEPAQNKVRQERSKRNKDYDWDMIHDADL